MALKINFDARRAVKTHSPAFAHNESWKMSPISQFFDLCSAVKNKKSLQYPYIIVPAVEKKQKVPTERASEAPLPCHTA